MPKAADALSDAEAFLRSARPTIAVGWAIWTREAKLDEALRERRGIAQAVRLLRVRVARAKREL
ncbi:MAG: hypothetical protein ABII76_27400 [Pseudomonadota bacterium]